MSSLDREELLKRIEEKKKLLADKKKQLDDLKQEQEKAASSNADADSSSFAAKAREDVKSILLNSISSEVKAASEEAHKKSKIEAEDKRVKLMQHLKSDASVIGVQSTGLISIVPQQLTSMERGIQADIPMEAPAKEVKDNKIGKPKSRGLDYEEAFGDILKAQQAPVPKTMVADVKKPDVQVSVMSQEEKQKLMSNIDFRDFLENSARLIEKSVAAISGGKDILIDYSGIKGDTLEVTETLSNQLLVKDPMATISRPVTSLQQSPVHGEIILASYGRKRTSSIYDPDGLVLLWNLNAPKSAEYAFHSHSPICSTTFNPFNPSVIVAGAYSGSLLLWDTRVKLRNNPRSRPVQRSAYSPKGHLHPVSFVKVSGTTNTHQLTSIDSDGRLCTWSLNMLVQPTESIDLKKGADAKESGVSVLAADMTLKVNDLFYCGADDGNVYRGSTHGQSFVMKKSGVVESLGTGHSGPITCVSCHPNTPESPQNDINELVLTSSVDWTVKLWLPTHKDNKGPKTSFEINQDYVFDVKWHPTNPSVFGTVDALGMVDVWDLSKDLTKPLQRTEVSSEVSSIGLSRMTWSSDGKHLIAGNNNGDLVCFDVADYLCNPKSEDMAAFSENLDFMKKPPRPAAGHTTNTSSRIEM